jgi:hypothetical protein
VARVEDLLGGGGDFSNFFNLGGPSALRIDEAGSSDWAPSLGEPATPFGQVHLSRGLSSSLAWQELGALLPSL